MERHFLPHFGAWTIADLATDKAEVALLDWLVGLRDHPSKRDGTPIASRTIRNVASAIRVFFADAAERKVVRRNPTLGWNAERDVPPIEDKERGWRQHAGFSLDQVVTLTTDVRVPEDRRVLYALRFLGGPRPGEAANRAGPTLTERGSRSGGSRWRRRSTAPCAGRSPRRRARPSRPDPPRAADAPGTLVGWRMGRLHGSAARVRRPHRPARGRQTALRERQPQAFPFDLEKLGFAIQRQYESQSTFRSLALTAGASEFHLNLITHPKPKLASDYYTRLEMQWPGMYAAVQAIPAAGWSSALAVVPAGDVMEDVTVTEEGTANEQPPATVGLSGVADEREKGFEFTHRELANHATMRCSPSGLAHMACGLESNRV